MILLLLLGLMKLEVKGFEKSSANLGSDFPVCTGPKYLDQSIITPGTTTCCTGINPFGTRMKAIPYARSQGS